MRYKLKDYVDLSYLEKMGFQKTYIDYSKISFSKSNDVVWFYELKDENNLSTMSIRIKDRKICIYTNKKMLFEMIKNGMVEEYKWEEMKKIWQEDHSSRLGIG